MNGLPPVLFPGEAHEPFLFQGSDTAALLVHGFPGTPAEMRPLGESLHQHGWTAEGLLLPGFGQHIGTLFERRPDEWVRAVRRAIRDLRRGHRQVILVAYSFGAMVSLNAVLQEHADRLVLVAPFWKLGGLRERLLWGLVRPFTRSFRPFKSLDFDSEQVAEGIGRLLPGLELGDPQVRESLRELEVPGDFIDGIGRLGRSARQAAEKIEQPVLVVQGEADEVVRPQDTNELCKVFPQSPELLSLPAGHGLIGTDSDVLSEISEAIRLFEAAPQRT